MKPFGAEPARGGALLARRFYKGAPREQSIPSRVAADVGGGCARTGLLARSPARSPRRAPVAVLGAGFAGLVVANELVRRGVEVIVLEAGDRVAGLATSHRDRDGFHHDVGAHFITNRLASELGVTAECVTLARYGEAVIAAGRAYGYPYGLLRVPRYLRGALASRLGVAGPEPVSAAEWFRAQYGAPLADEIALPLVEAWSGMAASRLSRAVGDKLSSSIARTLTLKMASVVSRRPVALGYSVEKPEHAGLLLVYPRRGVGALCDALAQRVWDRIRLGSPVERLHVEDGRVHGVRVTGVDVAVAGVVSTLPVHLLPRLAPGVAALERFRDFRYRPMIFVSLRLAGRGLLPSIINWTPEPELPFFRLVEAPMAAPWLAPDGKTLVMADIGAEVGDALWNSPDGALGELCVERLAAVVADARRRYLGCSVTRTALAYPVFDLAYEEARVALAESTGVAGLWSTGRNGGFAHILMEDVYWRACAVAGRVARTVEGAEPAVVTPAA